MSRTIYTRNNFSETFVCSFCGYTVTPPSMGSANRNHCPHCLHSRHVDIRTGDRGSGCRGIMEPIGIWVKDCGEWALIHRCARCGFLRTNRIAGDDNEIRLFTLAAKAMSQFPFPAGKTLERISGAHVEKEGHHETV